jgi:hypothetical protein
MQFSPHVLLTGILTECPFGAPQEGCLFNAIRKKPLLDRIDWLHSLSEHEQFHFVLAHKQCLIRRETGS